MLNSTNATNLYTQFMDVQKHPQSSIPNVAKRDGFIASTQLNTHEDQEKNGHALTKAVASIAIIGGVIGFLFTRNGSSKFYKKINAYVQKLDDKISEYKQKNPQLTAIQNVYFKLSQGWKKIFEWIGATNNLTAAKDIGFRALCDKIYLTKPMNWITNQFKKITIATSRKAYEKARNITDNNIAELRKILPDIKDIQLRKTMEEYINKLQQEVSGITTATTRQQRLERIEANTQNLGKEVGEELLDIVKDLKNKGEKLRLYRTEVLASKGKKELADELRTARRSFTYDINDKTKELNTICDFVRQAVKNEDYDSKVILKDIRKLIKKYSSVKGEKEKTERLEVIKELNSKVAQLKNQFTKNGKYSQETQKVIEGKTEEIISILDNTTDDMGTIEKMLTALKTAGFKKENPKACARATALTKEIKKAAETAFDSEMKLYDKFAEYSVGSAPTDAVGMLLPIILGGYAVSKGENKDEKLSATLKAGIPIIGGVATTFIAAAKMMTNMQGLLIGMATGLVLNALGSKADESYKHYQENSLFTQKAIAAYKQSMQKSETV